MTNKSDKEITISVDEGEKSSVVKIAAGKSATFKDECKYGCAVGGPWNFPGLPRWATTSRPTALASPAVPRRSERQAQDAS